MGVDHRVTCAYRVKLFAGEYFPYDIRKYYKYSNNLMQSFFEKKLKGQQSDSSFLADYFFHQFV